MVLANKACNESFDKDFFDYEEGMYEEGIPDRI